MTALFRGRFAARNVSLGPDTAPVDVLLPMGRISTSLTITASARKATASRLPVADDDLPDGMRMSGNRYSTQTSANLPSITKGTSVMRRCFRSQVAVLLIALTFGVR